MKRFLVFGLAALAVGAVPAAVTVDAELPAGNIVFEKIDGERVYVHQDLRDTTGDWFYWAMRVKGAAGRKLTFVFTRSDAVGVRGPVVTKDGGKTYAYPLDGKTTRREFTYAFGPDEDETWFYECHPYVRADWDAFAAKYAANPAFRTSVLCRSRKGAEVPVAKVGCIASVPKHRVLMTARHHCSETMASWVLEGVIDAFLAEDELGAWLRGSVELTVVPFTDYDGAQAGDQGKNRRPHDHNRDYAEFVYPETKAIAGLLGAKDADFEIYVDVHCPWLHSDGNECLYTPVKNPAIVHDAALERRFSELLERLQCGSMRYKASDDIPFGTKWNTEKNYTQGMSSVRWALANVPSLRIARTYEVPFANANGAVVTPETCRDLGRDTAKVYRALLAGDTAVGPAADRRAEAEARAAALVAGLTPSERLSQLMMDSPGIPRLGITPYHWWNEALHGLARAGLATVFPQAMAAAASFDAELQERIGDVVSTEARAKYNLFRAKGDYGIYRGLTLWSPNVNMFRDPRWGRGQETFGEDPFLAGVMGSAYVRGLQGCDPKYLKTAACAKHLAVHSGPESLRHGFNAKVSARDLNEYYLPAFKALVTGAKVESVMGAYSAINGTPCCASSELFNGILRGEWGFQGHVVSDVGAVGDICSGHKAAASPADAARAAMSAGLDLCSEDTYSALSNAVAAGEVSADELAVPLTRLYRTRVLLGQFDPPGSTPWDAIGAEAVATEANRELARRMAEESVVLVSNRDGTLPIDRGRTLCVGVGGPLATSEVALLGNYFGYTDRPVSVLSGFVGEAGAGLRVTGEPELHGCEVLVACIGITSEDEGEEGCSRNNAGADRADYGIAESQLQTLRDYRRWFPQAKLVAVVFGCSPFDLKPVVELCDAVLIAWYPGEQGGRAIARIVFGDVNPSGRLPITFPKSYDDLPDFADYGLTGRTYRYATREPLYPFGYGLSYTAFAYADAAARTDGEGDGRRVTVSAVVTNTGKVAGDEVVQVYVRAPKGSGDRRLHHLEGFRRVSLAPGEKRTVTVELPCSAFEVFGEDGRPFLPTGESTVFIGGGQPGFAATVSVPVRLD